MVSFLCLLFLFTMVHTFKINPSIVINEKENVTFEKYLNFNQIQAYLDTVVATYPQLASVQSIGNSLEGRSLRVIKIAKDIRERSNRSAVFMDAGVHAREWLGPPTVLHVVYQLTALAAQNQAMLDAADWYILPVANPDGYVYTWTQDRFWRKNRRINNGTECQGVDINRNFDVNWGLEVSSRDPCSTRYAGSRPNSEPEAVAISRFLLELKGRLSLYISIHSAAKRLLYPYGYNTNMRVRHELINAAEEAVASARKTRNTVYPIGSIATALYSAYGVSVDFAFDKAEAKYAYAWELPEGGDRRYDPPSSEILPVAQEIWEGLKILARHSTQEPNAYTAEHSAVASGSPFSPHWVFLIAIQITIHSVFIKNKICV